MILSMNHPELPMQLPWKFRITQAWEVLTKGTDTRYEETLQALGEELIAMQKARDENAGLLQANRDCSAWYGALQHDFEDCLKALGEIANYEGDQLITLKRIAKQTLNSLID